MRLTSRALRTRASLSAVISTPADFRFEAAWAAADAAAPLLVFLPPAIGLVDWRVSCWAGSSLLIDGLQQRLQSSSLYVDVVGMYFYGTECIGTSNPVTKHASVDQQSHMMPHALDSLCCMRVARKPFKTCIIRSAKYVKAVHIIVAVEGRALDAWRLEGFEVKI